MYIVLYDLICKYNGETKSVTRSVPITYFYSIEELNVEIYSLSIRSIIDFIGDGIYGYSEDYSEIALFLYSFNEDREFEEFSRVLNIGIKNNDYSKVYIAVCRNMLIDFGIEREEFIKCLNMELKMSNKLSKIIDGTEFIIE